MNTGTPSPRKSALRLPLVEVLRGLAAVSVLLFHSLAAFQAPGALHPALTFVQSVTRHGWLGVHVFFVLSGWCIAERLAAAKRKNERPAAFLLDRALRIYPTYWAALIFAIVLRLLASPLNHTPASAAFPSSALDAFGDVSLLHMAFGTPAYLVVSWTLFYEISFYAAAGLALVLNRRRLASGDALMLAGALLCAWPWLAGSPAPLRALERWPDFYLGVLAWRSARLPGGRLPFVCLIIYIACVVSFAFVRSDLPALLVTSGTASLLWIAARRSGRSTAPLHASPVLLRLGAASYSIYLIHVPVLSPLINLSGRLVPSTHATFVLLWLTAVALVFAASLGFHRFVEQPLENRRRRIQRPAPAAMA